MDLLFLFAFSDAVPARVPATLVSITAVRPASFGRPPNCPACGPIPCLRRRHSLPINSIATSATSSAPGTHESAPRPRHAGWDSAFPPPEPSNLVRPIRLPHLPGPRSAKDQLGAIIGFPPNIVAKKLPEFQTRIPHPSLTGCNWPSSYVRVQVPPRAMAAPRKQQDIPTG